MVQQSLRILRRPQVEQKIGLSRSAIYDRLDEKSRYHDPEFPKPVTLGNGKNPAVGWIEGEIDTWIVAQIRKSRNDIPDDYEVTVI